jgi:hypothetical protein
VYPSRVLAQHVNVTFISGTYYSDIIDTKYAPALTIQIGYAQFVGTATIQGSTNGTSHWYDIDMFDYSDPIYPAAGSKGYTVNGYHPYIKIKFDSTIGNVFSILAR